MKILKFQSGGGLFNSTSRINKKIDRKLKKLQKLTPNSDKPVLLVPPKNSINFGLLKDTENCGTPGIKGSCETDNLRAEKSKVVVMPKFNPNKSRFNLNKVGDPQQRKKLELEIEQLKTLLRKPTNGKYNNPRFL